MMITEEEKASAAHRLRDALGAAADVMTVRDSPVLAAERTVRRARGWLLPLAAAASMVVIVLVTVFVAGHFTGTSAPRGAAADGAAAPPEFYVSWVAGDDAPLLVHRTSDGAVTASIQLPAGVLAEGPLPADGSDRAFYFSSFATCTTGPRISRFYRITITGSGRFSGIAPVGATFEGMADTLAVSPDGSQIAYVLDPSINCRGSALSDTRDAVHIMDLSTGAVRTWQNRVSAAIPARVQSVTGLSWTPDGRTLEVDYEWASVPSTGTAPAVFAEQQHDRAVLGLDTTSGGGSLQASSRLLWHQEQSCVACAVELIAGPDGSLTASEVQSLGQKRTRLLVVRFPLDGGSPTVLYSSLRGAPAWQVDAGISADPSGQWVIAWPPPDRTNPSWPDTAGWISGGELRALPLVAHQSGSARTYGGTIDW
jgi:hypothetical protein